MSAFVNPDATTDVARERCYCSGSPHEHDTVTIRTQYGYGDLLELGRVHANGRIDPMLERAKLLELGIKSWSFVDDKGQPIPVGLPMILLLQQDVVQPIAVAIDEAYQASDPPVPNPSSGRSAPSSPASSTASPNRATRRAKRSTSK